MPSISSPASTEPTVPRRFVALAVATLALCSGLAGVRTAADDAGAATATVHQVRIEGMAFSPAELKVRPGDRVVFENLDLVPHTATAKGPGGFDSGVIPKGASWSVTVAEPGTKRYACLLHPTMTGTIIVGE